MTVLILGLAIFVVTHSVRIFADGWRARQIARFGAGPWKMLYSLMSAVGLVLIVWGYGQTRVDPVVLWEPAFWAPHTAGLLTAIAFILIAAAYVPGNRFKTKIGHPMLVGVKLWAFAHLLANGRAGDVVLFGAILAWAVADFAVSRRRDRKTGVRYPAGRAGATVITVAVGLIGWAVFAFLLHGWLIGVQPFG